MKDEIQLEMERTGAKNMHELNTILIREMQEKNNEIKKILSRKKA